MGAQKLVVWSVGGAAFRPRPTNSWKKFLFGVGPTVPPSDAQLFARKKGLGIGERREDWR